MKNLSLGNRKVLGTVQYMRQHCDTKEHKYIESYMTTEL